MNILLLAVAILLIFGGIVSLRKMTFPSNLVEIRAELLDWRVERNSRSMVFVTTDTFTPVVSVSYCFRGESIERELRFEESLYRDEFDAERVIREFERNPRIYMSKNNPDKVFAVPTSYLKIFNSTGGYFFAGLLILASAYFL